MLTLSSMANLIVECNLKGADSVVVVGSLFIIAPHVCGVLCLVLV